MSLKRQTVWSMMPLMVVSVVNLASVPLFFSYLGPEVYGLWFYVNTFSGMFGFADLGIGVSVGRYIGVALGRGDTAAVREYWGTGQAAALPLVALMGIVFTVLGVIFGPLWFKVAPEQVSLMRVCFVLGGLSLFLNYYSQMWVILEQAHLDFRFLAILRTAATLAGLLPSILIARATGNLIWMMSWGVGVSALQLGVYYWHSRRKYGLGLNLASASWARAREMSAYLAKIFASIVVGGPLAYMDRLVLGAVAPSPASAAPYAVCVQAGSRLQGLGVSVMGPVFHNTTRAEGRGERVSAAAIYNEMFNFTAGWYVLAVVWAAVWHPVFLHYWLDILTGKHIATAVSPVFTPVIAAFCLWAMASVSSSQLGALDRAGTALGFSVAGGVFAAVCVYVGWHMAGLTGVAYGFLISRLVFVAQDIYTACLVGALGWLGGRFWLGIAVQTALGGTFALLYFVLPRESIWLLLFAALHGGLVAVWLLRHPLRRAVTDPTFFRRVSASPAEKIVPGP
jgi:O-antigen/teichoic acid export membrane protein